MIIKHLLTIYITLLNCISLLGQTTIKGEIRDLDNNEVIAGALIYIYNNKTISNYTISNSEGTYEIVSKGDFTHIVFYNMGYKSLTYKPTSKQNHYSINIQLERDPYNLKSIVIKPSPLTIKGDTVTYNASSYTRAEDRTLKEILVRLPNVSVTTNGIIKVGETNINKFYIEDMDLLGGRYGIAVNNIRAEDIASVSIYNNHQPINILQDIEQSNQAALNIKLKSKAKQRWLFNIEGYLGAPSILYSAKVNTLNFSKKHQTIATAKSDNSGNNIVMETNIQNRKPGHFRLEDIAGIKDIYSLSMRVLPIPNEYYYFNKSNAVTFNRIYKLNNEATIRANIIFTTNSTKDYISKLQTITADFTQPIIIKDTNNFKRKDIRVSGEITYNLNNKTKYIDNIFSFKIFKDDAKSYISAANGIYNQRYDLPKLSFENNFSTIIRKNNFLLKFNNTISYNHIKGDLYITSDSLKGIIFNSNEAKQSVTRDNINITNSISFTKKIKKLKLSLEPQIKLSYNSFSSNLNNKENFSNNLSLYTLEPIINAKVEYSSKNIDFSLNTDMGYRYDFANTLSNKGYFIYKPSLLFNYNLSNSFQFRVTGQIYNDIGEINTMAKDFILTSYRNLIAYESPSKFYNQAYSTELRYSNYHNLIFGAINGSYHVSKSNTIPYDIYLNNYTFSTFADSSATNKMLNIGINARKVFGANIFSIGITSNFSYNISEQFIQDKLYKYNSSSFTNSLNLKYAPNDFLSANYTLSYIYTLLPRNLDDSNKNIQTVTNKIDINISPCNKLQLSIPIYHYIQKRSNYNDISILFINSSISYKLNERISLNGKINNILDTKSYTSYYISGASVISQSIHLRGIEFMLGASYNF